MSKESKEVIEYVLPLYDVVSFDLFDTFLLRTVINPSDLFLILGGGRFHDARTAAEGRTQRELRRPYTIDEIYERMPEDLRDMKQQEIDAEKQHITVNPYMMDVYRKTLEAGKKVVFTSDMYLPESVIRDILKAKGVTEFSGIYMSCDHGCSKGGGALFKRMLSGLGVRPESVVHIGDTASVDIRGGIKAGIGTYLIQRAASVFFSENPPLLGFFNSHGGMGNAHMRIIFGALALAYYLNRHDHGDDPWYRVGCTSAALLNYTLARWVLDKSKEMGRPKLILSLRDCYSLGTAMRAIAPDVECKYLACGRQVSKAVLDAGPDSEAAAEFRRYAESVITDPDNSLLVVDDSWWLSAERALASILPKPIPVIYGNSPKLGQEQAYITASLGPNLVMFETLGGAPMNPITGITDGKPVIREYNTHDLYVKSGMARKDRATRTAVALLHANGEYLTPDELRALMHHVYNMPTASDIVDYSNWRVSCDYAHNGVTTLQRI